MSCGLSYARRPRVGVFVFLRARLEGQYQLSPLHSFFSLNTLLSCTIPHLSAKHCFLEAGNGAEISFIEFNDSVEGTPGVTYPSVMTKPVAIAGHHHMAYRCESLEQMKALRWVSELYLGVLPCVSCSLLFLAASSVSCHSAA